MAGKAADLKALRGRLRAASGSDRELDIAVGGLWPNPPFNVSDKVFRNAKPVCPFFTASIDAALALCERKLPGWGFVLTTNDDGGFLFELCRNNTPGAGPDCEAPTAPLAILLALLEAMIGKETEAGL